MTGAPRTNQNVTWPIHVDDHISPLSDRVKGADDGVACPPLPAAFDLAKSGSPPEPATPRYRSTPSATSLTNAVSAKESTGCPEATAERLPADTAETVAAAASPGLRAAGRARGTTRQNSTDSLGFESPMSCVPTGTEICVTPRWSSLATPACTFTHQDRQ